MRDTMELPCGCVTGTEGDTFVMIACPAGKSCEWVQYVEAESARQGRPITVVEP